MPISWGFGPGFVRPEGAHRTAPAEVAAGEKKHAGENEKATVERRKAESCPGWRRALRETLL